MSALRDPEIRLVSAFLRAETMLAKRVHLQDFFRGGEGLLHAADKAAEQMEAIARELRTNAGALRAQGLAEARRCCPCCAGAGRKRMVTYVTGVGREAGVVACLTCEGRGEVEA